jgi:MYXO-CTERM domain-containing protein
MDRELRSNFMSAFSLLFLLLLNAPYSAADGRPTYPPSRHENDEGKPTPLTPRAHPYALAAGSGIVNVRFSVRMVGKKAPAMTVYLRRSGVQESIAMNDQGVNGDHEARDGIQGVSVPVDTSALAPDSCQNYEAFIKIDGSEVVSSPLQLCVSSLPVRTTKSNKTHPVVFPNGMEAVADEILITTNPNIDAAAIQTLATRINAVVAGGIPTLNLYQLKLATPTTAANLTALIDQLSARPEVKVASANAIGHTSSTPSDPQFSNQHGLQLVRANDMWDIGATGNGVTVTVLDTGLDRTHPDFGTPGNCQLAENDCGGVNSDAVGHGTQVAGVIGAKANNALGVAGVAYGAKIHAIQVSADALIPDTEMIQGFTDAAAYGSASIINASFGLANGFVNWTPLCTAINSAVLNAGVPVAVVVNSVGNDGINGNPYPARCNDVNAGLTRKDLFITVANSASVVDAGCGSVAVDQRCSDSNYGAWVDITAPGSAIRTTAVGGGYASPSGTSFSAPMVAGAAAILKSCGVPLDQIESTLRTSANVTVSFPDGSSAPRLDIYRAMQTRNRTPTALAISNTSLLSNLDTSGGVEVGTLTTTDPDTCDKWTYSIVVGADSAKFSIPTGTNRLILTDGVLNSASKPSYTVTVHVADFFGATFDRTLTVNVATVNHAPTIANQTFRINVGSANGTAVGTVTASDPDSGNVLSYSLAVAGNTGSAFSINPTSGAISVNNNAALAANTTFSLTVTVTDGGGLSASATVTVNVNKAPSLSNQSFSVNEGTANDTSIGAVAASDAGDTLSYSITAGNTSGAFSINSSTGVISVSSSAALVYATNPTFSLTVRVTDSGGLNTSATVTVNVNAPGAPVNNAPVIANQTFTINDGSANGTVVGSVVASDPDAGNTLTYSITGGNTGNAFSINASTGVLSVNAAVSYTSNPTFNLSVRVTDNGMLSTTATVTVNVNAPTSPTTPPTTPPAASGGGGGGGCSVMPAGADPDSSLALAVLVLLGYGLRRRFGIASDKD